MVERRRALDSRTVAQVAGELASWATAEPLFKNADRLAVYYPVGGEADPGEIAHAALTAGKSVYLPAIDGNSLRFRAWNEGSAMRPNRFGIPEPVTDDECDPADLDLVFAPLAAFDGAGNRIGMGSGFYDRTFAFLREDRQRRPCLTGVAYEFQRQAAIAAQPWDVPLHGILTERGWTRFQDREQAQKDSTE